jgi:hypothetical protein
VESPRNFSGAYNTRGFDRKSQYFARRPDAAELKLSTFDKLVAYRFWRGGI